MAGVRKALIVATDQYTDPKLTQLNAPAEDARALAEVLQNPDVGAYDVQTVLNGTCQEVEIAVATFFQSGARDDTLLVHFSCHGVKDLSGELYFATSDTKLPLLKVTAVSSAMVKQAMEESRASLILCLVDCCYSGAFTKSTKAAATVDLTERLGGRGRAVITASTSLQLALDGQQEASLFTHAVVEGLRSGEADRDLDGLVTLDEFYNYIHEKVTEKNPDQTPVKSFDVQGEVYVARRGAPISTPAPLPRELVDTLATGEDWQRLGAVSRLTDLLNAGHPGRALGARQALENVRDNDDSIKVRKAAEAALQGAGDTEAIPLIPQYVESVPVAENFEDFETAGAKSATTTVERTPPADTVTDVPPVEPTPVADTVADEPPVVTGAGRGPTALAGGLTSGTASDVPVIPGGSGGGGTIVPPTPEPDRRWSKWLVMGAAAAAVIVGLFFVGLLLGDDDGGDANPEDGSPTAPTDPPTNGEELAALPRSELLVPVERDGRRVLIAVDVDKPDVRRDLVDLADLPSLSTDRKWLWYVLDIPGPDGTNRVVYGSEVVPAHRVRLLDKNALANCPSSSRPAVDRSGGLVALVCREPSFDQTPGVSRGLFYGELDGNRLDERGLMPVAEDSRVIEAPSWTGDNELIFVADEWGPDGQSALLRMPKEGSQDPIEVTDGTEGWDSSPDWSEAGVLFLRRTSRESKTGDVWVLEAAGPRQLTSRVQARWPTWSPDGKRIAYLVVESPGVRSLWVLDVTDPDASPERIPLEGNPGPPAWSES